MSSNGEPQLSESSPRVGVVLGAGGAVGHAFHAGVLAGIADATGWDARDAEVVVGTSAGSIVGALIRADISGPDLAVAMAADHEDLPGIPSRASRRRVPTMSAPGALVRAALRPWTARPGALAAAALPEGRISTDVVSAGLRPLFDAWPEAPLWINAVELDSGRRVTFTGGLGIEVDVATAVAASCAIPAFFAPVTIQGVRYVDGAAHSPTNADLVAGIGLDLVVISSPMSIAARTPRLATDEPFRRLARLVLAREANRIRRAGTPVLTFQPTGRDLTAMGSNNMDTSRRANVIHRVRDSTRRRLVRADALDRAAILAVDVASVPRKRREWARPVSNRRHTACKAAALPAELRAPVAPQSRATHKLRRSGSPGLEH